MNRTQKILSRFVQGATAALEGGTFLRIRPHAVLTHDNTAAVMSKFESLRETPLRVKDPQQIVFALDHNVQDTSLKNLDKYDRIKAFARRQGIDFYPSGRGIGHQIMVEEGYAYPNTLVVASDSHANMYGGLGCLGTPVVRTDAAAIWGTGNTWWQVPPVTRVTLHNTLPKGATGKDVIIALCSLFSKDEILNHALEFDASPETLETLSVDDRLSIANMTTEWGALSALFPVDRVTLDWLYNRAHVLRKRHGAQGHPRHSLKALKDLETDSANRADPGASYAAQLSLDLASVEPHIAGPNTVKEASSLSVVSSKNISIQKAYLVSCVNSRASDLKAAAEVVKGHSVAPGVEFYVAAASSEVQAESELSGDWATLLAAGAKPLPAGCGPCIGLGAGLLKDHEVGISATNRNYKGRMGSPLAQTYLASPAIVAASAIKGVICGPETWTRNAQKRQLEGTIITTSDTTAQSPTRFSKEGIFPGFEPNLLGELVFCDHDNLNTDGIYPGKYTYQDDLTPKQMAEVVMENYDPKFASSVQKNDILVGGFNFGTGSSREQAATSLLYAGIRLVLAGSFSETFKRNAINNGLLVLEAPQLVRDLRNGAQSGKKTLTQRTGQIANIQLDSGSITLSNGKKYRISPVGIAAQELLVEGGLEAWVKKQLQTQQ